MKTSRRGAALRKLLDLCDDLQSMRTRMSDPAVRRDTRTRLRQQVRTKTQQLADDLVAYRYRGPLGEILRETKLESRHFLVLAILLQRHLRGDSAALTGREILSAVFDSSFAVLQGLDLLHEDSSLRASGLIEVEEEDEFADDVLEASFRISPEALVAFREEISGVALEDQLRNRKAGGYNNNREYLIDLRILHNLFRHLSLIHISEPTRPY